MGLRTVQALIKGLSEERGYTVRYARVVMGAGSKIGDDSSSAELLMARKVS
jgi:hypothetical protein